MLLTHVRYLGSLFRSSFTLTFGLKWWTWSVEPNAWTWVAGVFLLSVLSSSPLPELKCGEKGREQRKAAAGRRWINGRNRCVETGREGDRLRGGGAQCCTFAVCAPYSLAFSCIMLPGDTRNMLFIFFHQIGKKLLHHSYLKSLPIGEENTLPKCASTGCFKNVKIKRLSNDPPTANTLSKIFHIGLAA